MNVYPFGYTFLTCLLPVTSLDLGSNIFNILGFLLLLVCSCLLVGNSEAEVFSALVRIAPLPQIDPGFVYSILRDVSIEIGLEGGAFVHIEE